MQDVFTQFLIEIIYVNTLCDSLLVIGLSIGLRCGTLSAETSGGYVMTRGERIRELRKARGVRSTRQLAQAINATYSGVWNIENDQTENPSIELLQKIADYLQVPVTELLNATKTQETSEQSWAWFWRSRFALLRPSEIIDMRHSAEDIRATWCLRELLAARSMQEIAELLDEPAQHLAAIVADQDQVSRYLIDKLEAICEVPPNWLLLGTPPAIDEDLRKILTHPHGGAYLLEIRRAIDNRILPELLARQINFIVDARNDKPPTK